MIEKGKEERKEGKILPKAPNQVKEKQKDKEGKINQSHPKHVEVWLAS